MTAQELIALEERYGAHNYHPLDVVVRSASGCWVEDVDGRRYLDCLAAYSAVNQGHCHPRILEAFVEQARRVTLTSRAFRNDQLPLFYRELHELTGFDASLPMNSGAEAVETAVKAARKWGYTVKGIPADRAEIVCCTDNFHGRTTTIVSFSTEPQYRDGFGPMTPGFPIARYGDIEDLRAKITPSTAAFLVEPIQGEAGIVVPPDGYLRAAERLCREHNVLLVCDEIQSGLGRAGRMFAYQYEDVRPDMIIVGKALSGGFYPVSAVCGRADVLGVFTPGDHGSTFGGNPLAAAVARASMRVIVEERLAERESPHRRRPRPRPVDRRGARHAGASDLRGADGRGHPLQGDARERHPLRPAARHYARRDRLGLRTHREGVPHAVSFAARRSTPRR
jgi:ornithine--oxo-acid transaminase